MNIFKKKKTKGYQYEDQWWRLVTSSISEKYEILKHGTIQGSSCSIDVIYICFIFCNDNKSSSVFVRESGSNQLWRDQYDYKQTPLDVSRRIDDIWFKAVNDKMIHKFLQNKK